MRQDNKTVSAVVGANSAKGEPARTDYQVLAWYRLPITKKNFFVDDTGGS